MPTTALSCTAPATIIARGSAEPIAPGHGPTDTPPITTDTSAPGVSILPSPWAEVLAGLAVTTTPGGVANTGSDMAGIAPSYSIAMYAMRGSATHTSRASMKDARQSPEPNIRTISTIVGPMCGGLMPVWLGAKI